MTDIMKMSITLTTRT